MEILVLIGIVIVIIAVFTGGGIFGWILNGIEWIFELLLSGWTSIFGCLWRLFVIGFAIVLLAALL